MIQNQIEVPIMIPKRMSSTLNELQRLRRVKWYKFHCYGLQNQNLQA